jgi:hypothetical protein
MIDTSALSALLSGYNSQTPAIAPPTVAPTATTNPFAKFAGLFNGDTNLGDYAQKVGMGLSNMSSTGGDPYLAFAQGFGGTAKFTTAEQAAAAAAKQKEIDNAIAANKLAMDQNQFDARLGQDQSQFNQRMGQDQSQFDTRQTQQASESDRDYALRQAADKRQQMLADQEVKKSAAEIERMARGNGITVDQQLQIERIAQAAAENIVDPEERKKTVDAERQRLTDQFKTGDTSLSNGPGVSAQEQQPMTATGPNGEKLVLKNGQWVPLQ